jgi:ubiquinone/menaquinone biosynthesis C-methylase UbiE
MDADLRRAMLRYYDERAPEYEDAYLRGTGTSSIRDPRVFVEEIQQLAPVVARIARGRIIDIACGTAFWLPWYAPHCSSITLIDQSKRMLEEARRKTASLTLDDRSEIIRADVLAHDFPRSGYDTALAGFFVSHLTEEQEARFLDALRRTLAPSGRLLILDSAWTPARAAVNRKVERQSRRLNDGTTFEIYKRYLDRDDIARWSKYGATTVEHFGTAFLGVTCSF